MPQTEMPENRVVRPRSTAASPALLSLVETPWRAALCLGLSAGLLTTFPADGAVLQPQYGLHYYAIENLDDPLEIGGPVLRGKAGSLGYAHDNIILTPNTRYREWILQVRTMHVAVAEFLTPDVGQRFLLPDFVVRPTAASDIDGDGLHGEAEFILGTDPENPDTDGDGVLDGAEVQQGLDPLTGLAAQTGVIAAADTPGVAVDVCVLNDLAIVADSQAGVAVFGVFSGLNPTLLTQVDTPGNARAVACAGNVLLVADGPAGLAVIDIGPVEDATIRYQVNLGGDARAVATDTRRAFVGLSNGQLVSVDVSTGDVMDRVAVGGTVQDLALEGETLFCLLDYRLLAFDLTGGDFRQVGSVATSSFQAEGISGRRRLFVGGGEALATGYPGFDRFEVSDVTAMQRVGAAVDQGPNSFKQIVANGSGLGIAPVGVNPRNDGTHDLYLYDLTDPTITTDLQTVLPTPGVAYAVALYNGLAYVADGENGLQVANYLAFDNQGQPPTLTLAASFPLAPGRAEEGQLARVTARVSDDVQVRNVEFYVNGTPLVIDGNFPFEARFITPLASPTRSSFTLQARATDTGGNTALSSEITVDLVPDATPPYLRRTHPRSGAIVGAVDSILGYFSEPLAPTTLTPESFYVVAAGPDGIPFSPDDIRVTNETLTHRPDQNAVELQLPGGLEPGLHRIVAQSPLADLRGNTLARTYEIQFWVTGGADRDQDGVPDDVEELLGLDPDQADTDGDGVIDGFEDPDGDGLRTAWELAYGLDPRTTDTNNDGVPDPDEDTDNDTLTHLAEQAAGTNPFSLDSDADGWPDEGEVVTASDPLDPRSRPSLTVAGQPRAQVVVPVVPPTDPLDYGTVLAEPRAEVVLPDDAGITGVSLSTLLGQPTHQVVLPAVSDGTGTILGTLLGEPTAQVTLPTVEGTGASTLGTLLGLPAVQSVLPAGQDEGLPTGTLLGQPPVHLEFLTE